MLPERQSELRRMLLSIFSSLNAGPGQNVPVKTLWMKSMADHGLRRAEEFNQALQSAIEAGDMIQTPGGVAGLGSVSLSDAAYAESRDI